MKLRRLVTREPVAGERHDDRSVHPHHLLHAGMRVQVGRHQTVGDEVAVVGFVAELAAVREAAFAARQSGEQAVVLPLPDEPALQAGRRRDHVPVVGERAVRVAHRVAVLAHDQRSIAGARASVLGDRVDRRIHRAHHVARCRPAVDPAVVEHRALVVQRSSRVRATDPTGHRIMVAAVAGLVAERPHDRRSDGSGRVRPCGLHATTRPIGTGRRRTGWCCTRDSRCSPRRRRTSRSRRRGRGSAESFG